MESANWGFEVEFQVTLPTEAKVDRLLDRFITLMSKLGGYCGGGANWGTGVFNQYVGIEEKVEREAAVHFRQQVIDWIEAQHDVVLKSATALQCEA